MADTDIVMALTDDALGRLIADTALNVAHAQLLLDAALDELACRQEQSEAPDPA